jgi:hypothetical protein
MAQSEESNYSEPPERGARSSASPRVGPRGSRRRSNFFILVDSERPERGTRSSASPRALDLGSQRRTGCGARSSASPRVVDLGSRQRVLFYFPSTPDNNAPC